VEKSREAATKVSPTTRFDPLPDHGL